jgi:hydroxyacylglutathione hydrolase
LETEGVTLTGILVTHHHADHTGGIDALRERTGAWVVGPARETIPAPFAPLHDGDHVDAMGLRFQVLDVPGHTAGHIAYYCDAMNGQPLLFCGDTLFSAGCGRLFEGTPAQMQTSLERLAALPDATQVCCTHEYTLSNLRFALAVDPANADLQAYARHCQTLRDQALPTLPSRIDLERRINPFLRTATAAIQQSLHHHDATTVAQEGAFAALRRWKNDYR